MRHSTGVGRGGETEAARSAGAGGRTGGRPPAALRPIFIGGCPRSGTTMLGALLGAHSRCVCVPESPFKHKLWKALDWESGSVRRPEVERLLRGRFKFVQWGITFEEVWERYEAASQPAGASLTFAETVRAMVSAYAERVAAAAGQSDADPGRVDTWVDHTPFNIRFAATLLESFPQARLIHLVRDGRAVAASLLGAEFGPTTVPGAARLWVESTAYGIAAERYDPERVHRIMYEDLVRRPEATLRELCGFLELPWEEGLGTRSEFRVPRFTRGQHALVGRPPDPERAESWRARLTRREIEQFEAASFDLLRLLGYRPEFGGRARRISRLERWRLGVRAMGGRARTGIRHLARRLRFRAPCPP